MNAAVYYRVSTVGQAAADRQSLPAQHEDAEAWCIAHDLTVVGEFEDHETGTRPTRAGYQALLALCRKGGVDVIVVREFSRFGRDDWEAMRGLGELMMLGVEVHEYGPNHIIQRSDASALIVSAAKATAAASVAKETRRNSARGRMRSAEAGIIYMGRSAYGYVKRDHALVVNEPQAQVVRDIFTWYTKENLSFGRIANRLNVAGIPTFSGKRWFPHTVKTIVKNSIYAGTAEWAGFRQPAPAIIPASVWEEARARRERKGKMPAGQTQVSTHLLSGIVKCGACHKAVICKTSHPKGYTYRRYICSASRYGACTNKRAVKAEWLEDYVVRALSNEQRRSGERAESDLARLQAELATVVESMRTVRKNFEEQIRASLRGVAVDFAQTVYEEEMTALERTKADIEAEVRAVARRREAAAEVASSARDFAAFIAHADPQQAKIAVQTLVKMVVIPQDEGSLPTIVL